MHQRVADQRVNRVNFRREFFYTTPTEVREHLKAFTGELLSFEENPGSPRIPPELEVYRGQCQANDRVSDMPPVTRSTDQLECASCRRDADAMVSCSGFSWHVHLLVCLQIRRGIEHYLLCRRMERSATKTPSCPTACQSAPLKKPSTAPAGSTSTPHRLADRLTPDELTGADHLALSRARSVAAMTRARKSSPRITILSNRACRQSVDAAQLHRERDWPRRDAGLCDAASRGCAVCVCTWQPCDWTWCSGEQRSRRCGLVGNVRAPVVGGQRPGWC